MKRNYFVLSVVAASVLTAGLTAFGVSKLASNKYAGTRNVEYADGERNVPSHFTVYESGNYPDLTYAAENAVKAVVNIEKIEEVPVRSRSEQFNPLFELFGLPQQQSPEGQPQSRERRSGGSGAIITPDGYIVTNNHVIENATRNSTSKLKVKLNDGRLFDGRVVGADPSTDIALIKIEGTDLPSLSFGNSNDLRLGEWVLAIGSPYDLPSTVTAGIVSAKARNLSVIPDQLGVESFIQTDAAVNPGNSGGPLVNVRGEIVGINTVIKSPTGSFTGYSFAVPSSIASKVVGDLREYGVVQRALLGIQFSEINDRFLEKFGKEYGITEPGGLYVAEVTAEGAAEAAGIKKGDIITAIDDSPIVNSSTLLETIAQHRPNDKVKITVKRGGAVKHFDVVLRNKAGKTELLTREYVDPIEALGGKFADITDKAKKDFKIKGGVMVQSITEGGILSQARVRKGYIITHVNDREITSVADLQRINEKITSLDGVYPPDGRSASYSLVPVK